MIAGWSSLAARRAHNPKVVGSNPAPATSAVIKLDSYIFSEGANGAFLLIGANKN